MLQFLNSVFLMMTPFKDFATALTLIYSGEAGGQLGLQGRGTEQFGGLSRRQTVIESLREKYANVQNLHTGTFIDPTDPNEAEGGLNTASTLMYLSVL